ncbi:MAG: hypothetical protein IPI08_10915 [Betaproteobacteria bacterium]|nr:hypothetical protein [Betaproteobacteria bacterium]MBK8106478.1 hypothetical protein [Betaproteobacteria bacterium]
MRAPANALLAAVTLAYPLLVYLGAGRLSPAWIAVPLALLALLRAWVLRQPLWYLAAGGVALLALASTQGGGWLSLKLYPVLVNALMLGVFAASLVRGPTIVERLARLSEPDLPAHAVAYTRRVTQIWCAFFVFNGTAALVTSLWASTGVWTVYNGLVAYLLMGLLFGVEFLVRQRVKARAGGPEVRHG